MVDKAKAVQNTEIIKEYGGAVVAVVAMVALIYQSPAIGLNILALLGGLGGVLAPYLFCQEIELAEAAPAMAEEPDDSDMPELQMEPSLSVGVPASS